MQFITVDVNNSKARLFCYRQETLSLDEIVCISETKA